MEPQIIAWFSTICLALCGLPLAVQSIRRGRNTISPWFLWLWFSGEVAGLYYVLYLKDWALVANYYFNTMLIIIVLYYRYYPRPRRKRYASK